MNSRLRTYVHMKVLQARIQGWGVHPLLLGHSLKNPTTTFGPALALPQGSPPWWLGLGGLIDSSHDKLTTDCLCLYWPTIQIPISVSHWDRARKLTCSVKLWKTTQNPRKAQAWVLRRWSKTYVTDVPVKKRTRRARGAVHSDCIMMYRLATAKINSRIWGKSGMPSLTLHQPESPLDSTDRTHTCTFSERWQTESNLLTVTVLPTLSETN